METVNANSWSTLKTYLRQTKANVIIAQETKLPPGSIDEASQAALRMGWKSLHVHAEPGPKGGMSGGVAILCRQALGLRELPGCSTSLWPGRAIAGMLDLPGYPPMPVLGGYLA